GLDRLQERPLDEEAGSEDVVDGSLVLQSLLGQGADVQELAGIVPLVEGLVGVDPLVALQPDELEPESRSERLGQFGFADAGFSFEQERTSEAKGQVGCGRQATVGQVILVQQNVSKILNRLWNFHPFRPSVAVAQSVPLSWQADNFMSASALSPPGTPSTTQRLPGGSGVGAMATRLAGERADTYWKYTPRFL